MSSQQNQLVSCIQAITLSCDQPHNINHFFTTTIHNTSQIKVQRQCDLHQNLTLTQPKASQKINKTQKLSDQQKKNKQKFCSQTLKAKKHKKNIFYKCKVCKTQGKKQEVIMCSKCKFYFHKDCLDENKIIKQSRTFVCQICQNPTFNLPKTSKIIQKYSQETAKQLITTQNDIYAEKQRSTGFLNVSDLLNVYRTSFKREEWKRKLFEFYKRYTFCFQANRIIFPIEDHLLHIYQSIFPSYCKTTLPRPVPQYDSLNIPYHLHNNLFQVEVFFVNFWQDLKARNYFLAEKRQLDQYFQVQKFNRLNIYMQLKQQGISKLYVWIVQILLRMYLNDIIDKNRIDNMKYISSNPFFNLLAAINENQGLSKQFIIKTAPQIIKNIIRIPSFRRSFLTEFNGQPQKQLEFPKDFTIQAKLQLITKLIRGLCDTECFKDIVIKKSEMIGQLTKEKGEIFQTQKSVQSQNLLLRQKIKQLEKQLKDSAFQDPKQYTKKYEPLTKKLEKLVQIYQKNIQKIFKLKEKAKQITQKVPFVNNLVKFLGIDRFKSQYFFYLKENYRIYVNYRQSLLEQSETKILMFYQGKEKIQQLKNWLNPKGFNQRSLLFNINNLEQKDLIISASPSQIQSKPDFTKSKNELKFEPMHSVSRQEIISILKDCQRIYRQTLSNEQNIPARQKQLSQIFSKLTQVDSGQNKIQPKVQKQLLIQLKVLFSKYPVKLWNWNEKVRKYWFEFLDLCSQDNVHLNEANLLILAKVWEITVKLHHGEKERKRQKIEKKKQRQNLKILKRQKQNILFGSGQAEMQNSSPENSITPDLITEGHNAQRRLIKRQSKLQKSPECNQSGSQSIESSSNTNQIVSEDKVISEIKLNNKSITKNQNGQTIKKYLASHQRNNKKAKINSTDSQYQSSNQQTNSSASYSKQSSQCRRILRSQSKTNHQKDESAVQEQVFCQQCFENINFEQYSQTQLVNCIHCSKIYHRECLDEDDILRLGKHPKVWTCEDCQTKNPLKSNKKNHSLNIKQTIQNNKKTINQQGNSKSKVTQKALKKFRKNAEDIKKVYKTETNQRMNQKSEPINEQNNKTRITINQKKKSAANKQNNQVRENLNKKLQNLSSLNVQRQMTRKRKNKNRIIEESSEEISLKNQSSQNDLSI